MAIALLTKEDFKEMDLKELKEMDIDEVEDVEVEELDLGEHELLEILVLSAGVSLKQFISDWINKYVNLGELAGLLAGFLIYKFGDRVHYLLKTFGKGILIGAVAQLIQIYVVSKITSPTATVKVTPLVETPQVAAFKYALGGYE